MIISPAMPQPWIRDDKRGISGSRDVSLTIFITSISGSKSLTSLAYRFFHFRKPLGLRLALTRPKGKEHLAAFSARRVKREAAEERGKKECFFVARQCESK